MYAGQPNSSQHAADAPQALAPDFRGHRWQVVVLYRLDRPLVDDPVQFPGNRVPPKPAADRIRSIPGETGYLQRLAVQIEYMAGTVGHHDGLLGAHLVQILPVEKPVLRRLGIVELESLHPIAGGRNPYLLPQRILNCSDGRQRAVGGHYMANTAAQHMDMSVNQSWQHGLSLQVQDLGPLAHQIVDAVVVADGDELPIADRHGLSPGLPGVDGDDVGITDY